VLAIAGFLLVSGRIGGGQRDFGAILIGCGFSAMVFGLLYGSVFADEHVLPALWARPIENIQFFIQLAIGFGALAMSLGLIFGIFAAWRRRDFSALSFGPNGIAGLWLYWGLIAVIALAVAGNLSLLSVLLLLGPPLGLIFFHGPLSSALGWHGPAAGGATYYVQAGVESFDLVVRLVSNTVSFLRIAAFALSHAGLGITVVTLAEMLHGVPGASLATMVLGNAVIVLLEGLIVGIQALRLQYYEFFTKFLVGQGVPYRPFTLAFRPPEALGPLRAPSKTGQVEEHS
jgi:V/A-type H+-transporting ATPase subunit I